jgi:hypothetical protein
MQRRRALLVSCVACACLRAPVAAPQGLPLEGSPPPGPVPVKPAPPRQIDPATDTGLLLRPEVQTGDEWVYRRSTGTTSRVMRQTITGVNEQGMTLKTEDAGSPDSSVAVHDRNWGLLGSGFNDYRPALAYYSFPLYVGKRWGVDSNVSNFGAGQSGRMRGEGRAIGWETVVVPAGRFLAMKIEVSIETADPGDPQRTLMVRERHWYSRVVLRPVRVESETTIAGETPKSETVELMSYRIE